MSPVTEEWVKLLASPFLAAVLAVLLATPRLRSETKWRAKYDAYQRMLAAVEDIRYWAEEAYAHGVLLPSIGSKRLEAARDRYEEAKRVLLSQVYVGALAVSDRARDRLEQLLAEIATEEHEFDQDPPDDLNEMAAFGKHCDRIRGITNGHIPHILKVARRDLGYLPRFTQVRLPWSD